MRVLSTIAGDSLVAIVTDPCLISLIIREEHGMPCSSQIISEILSEIHIMKECYFLKPIIQFQII